MNDEKAFEALYNVYFDRIMRTDKEVLGDKEKVDQQWTIACLSGYFIILLKYRASILKALKKKK